MNQNNRDMAPSQGAQTAPATAQHAQLPPDSFLSDARAATRLLTEYIQNDLVEGKDYGHVGSSKKPCLFKPGAEKLNVLYNFAPLVKITNRVEDWAKGFVSYEVKVTLVNKRSRQIEGQGLGSCNSQESRYARQNAANIANTVLKIAKKRALIDATLSATACSEMFTQDLDDMDFAPGADAPQNVSAQRQAPAEDTRRSRPANGSYGGGGFDRNEHRPRQSSGGGAPAPCTEPQIRAVEAIANRVWGQDAGDELARLLNNRQVTELSKSDASKLIDKLREQLAERQSQNGSYAHAA